MSAFEGRVPRLKQRLRITFLDLAASQILITEQVLESKLDSVPHYAATVKQFRSHEDTHPIDLKLKGIETSVCFCMTYICL